MNINGINLRSDFGDPLAEARACRNDCAIFDFSFIASARVTGKGAQEAVEKFTSRPLDSMETGRIAYAVRTDEKGYAVSDLTIWKIDTNCFDVMSGRSEDVASLCDLKGSEFSARDITEENVTFAVQGPHSLDVLCEVGAPARIRSLKYYAFADCEVAGIPCRIGRLGYTGEAGFEIIASKENILKLRKRISGCARPAGFIAADILRIEAGFVLFTNEFRLPVSPAEAGLDKFYIRNREVEPELKLVTFCADSSMLRPLPWSPHDALSRPKAFGEISVTSACRSPLHSKIVGLGYILRDTPQSMALEDPSGVFRNISQTAMPIYDPMKLRPRAEWGVP